MEEEKKMSKEDIEKALDGFFRFYDKKDCGFNETRPAYEKIVESFVKVGVLAEGATLDSVIEECKKIDAAEVVRTGGKVKESNIGLQGYFASLKKGFSEKELEDDTIAKKLYEDYKIEGPLPEKASDRLQAINMAIGNLALKALGEPPEKDEKSYQAYVEASAFLGSLAAGPYFPRQTCFSASHFMSEGSIMQIGCSQGKTSVVAMTTYEQLMAGKKVFSTSSAPGLVPENYDEAKAFYEKMGIAEQFCAISQNVDDKKDNIVIFHSPEKRKTEGKTSNKYEIKEDGTVVVDTTITVEKDGEPNEDKRRYKIEQDGKIYTTEEYKEDGKKKKRWVELEKPDDQILEAIGYTEGLEKFYKELGLEVKDEKYDFKESVRKMMSEKGIIMGDTITLGKYQDLMPKRNSHGVIDNSYLIVDEADAELLDTQPQEILGEEYQEAIANKRWEDRKKAKEAIDKFEGTPKDLANFAKEQNLPLDFVVDAYEAKQYVDRDDKGNPVQYSVKDRKIFILNPNTNVMIPASQGLSQAIIANDLELSGKHLEFPEMEVLGETDIPKLFSNFEVASLMSGTMQDKGMSDRASEEQRKAYAEARKVFLTSCGPGVKTSAIRGVKDWKLVTPQTREEKGNVVVNLNGINRTKGKNSEISTAETTVDIDNWKEYLELNGEQIDKKWEEAIRTEADTRSKEGQPVMISVYGGRNPMDKTTPVYTDKNQIGSKENGTEDHKIDDDTCMFVDNGVGEVACFDDFYGRGYTFKFIDRKDGEVLKNEKGKPAKTDKGGHVLITSFPQNSRNLEQFLFRVARGGDKGSSSIIISPTDPVLTEYLERLEDKQGKEAANQYLQGVLSGKIDVMQMIVDIYPEQTKDLFHEKANQVEARRVYEQELAAAKQDLSMILAKGNNQEIVDLTEYEKEFRKEILKQSKLNRQSGVNLENIDNEIVSIRINVVKNMIKEGKFKNTVEIVSALPVGLSVEQLEEVVPDKKMRESIIQLNDKIDRYIERKNQKEEKNTPVSEREETDKRMTGQETYEVALEDPEYNLSEAEKALAEIRETKNPNKEKENEQIQQSNDDMTK